MSVLLIGLWPGVLTALVCVLVVAFVWNRRRPAKSPPFEAGLIPWVGVVPQFAKHPVGFATQKWRELGDVFTLRLAGKRCTFLVGPEAQAPFFRSEDSQVDQNEPYSFSVPIFGPGVVYDVPQSMRYQQLRFLRNSLSHGQLNLYVPQIVEECEQFFKQWGNEGEVSIREELAKLIILTASRCLMGPEIREHLSDQVAKIFQELDEGLLPISVFFPYLPIPAHRKRDHARQRMVELFASVMKERRAHPDAEYKDVLGLFMNARYTTDKGVDRYLTDAEVAGLMIALLFAGQHTSSITASWTGLLLLHNKQFLPPITDEIHNVLAEFNGQLTHAGLLKMAHLRRAIKEALRMNPPLIFVMRKALVPIECKDYVIPTGDYLFVSPAISMRDPAVFKNPDQYNPDRFAPPNEEDSIPYSFIGFGGGRHSCMGEPFAYLQISSIWSILLRDFDLEPVGSLPQPDYTAMVVGPQEPARIRYRRKVPI